MGGFYLVRRTPGADAPPPDDAYRDSLGVFAEKKLRLHREVHADDFDLYVFHKRQYDADNFLALEGDGFLCATGTLIYKKRTGSEALAAFYQDFDPQNGDPWDLIGNYCVILRKDGTLYLQNDITGLYHVFVNTERTVFSSSLLAVARSVPTRTLATQEFYEYLVSGATYGDRTVLAEVDLVGSKKLWVFDGPSIVGRDRTIKKRGLERGTADYDDILRQIDERLGEYFEDLRDAFGPNDLCSALSGGYDSRLMLGAMQKVGVDPWVYVYGSNDSIDVRLAKQIAAGEGFTIHHRVREDPEFTPETYREVLHENFYFKDNLHTYGFWEGGIDLETRLQRTAHGRLQLNGGGGTQYRDFFYMPDRSLDAYTFVQGKYDNIDDSTFAVPFKKRDFLAEIAQKILMEMEIEGNVMSRYDISMVLSLFHGKYWMGCNNTLNCQVAHTLTPYGDPRLIWQAGDVPVKLRFQGRFEADLIKLVAPRLAAYPSAYGFNFVDPRPLRKQIPAWARINVPFFMRPFLRRNFGKKKGRAGKSLPSYLTRDFREQLGLTGELGVSEHIDVNRLQRSDYLSRALSVEVLLRDGI